MADNSGSTKLAVNAGVSGGGLAIVTIINWWGTGRQFPFPPDTAVAIALVLGVGMHAVYVFTAFWLKKKGWFPNEEALSTLVDVASRMQSGSATVTVSDGQPGSLSGTASVSKSQQG